VLLLDATYFACCVSSGPPREHAERLCETVSRLQAELQPRLTLAAFDSGQRKAIAPGSADARRQRREGGPPPTHRLGNSAPLASALLSSLGVQSVTAPIGCQGDDLLAAWALAVGGEPRAASLRVLIASGDSDAQGSLRRAGAPGARVDWLRVGAHPCARWPQPLTLVSFDDFFHASRFGFAPRRYPLYAAFVGRPRDGCAGIHGVGEAAAGSLLRRFAADPAVSDEAVAAAVCAAARAGALRAFRPEVGAALAAEGVEARLLANLQLTQPKLHAAGQEMHPLLASLLASSAA